MEVSNHKVEPVSKADVALVQTNKTTVPKWAWFLGCVVIVVVIGVCLFCGSILLMMSLIAPSASRSVATQIALTQTAISPSMPTSTATVPARGTETAISPSATITITMEAQIEQDDIPMVLIPHGTFVMGSYDLEPPHAPTHTVFLNAYYMDVYEVSNEQYSRCVEATTCSPPVETSSFTREHYYDDATFANYPVINVTWQQADTYCRWRGARLPTEAEWEKAARGTDDRIYPWGHTFEGSNLNACDNNCPFGHLNKGFTDHYSDTAPVGTYPTGISPYGVHDMAGNVWEWVNDIYDPTYYADSPTQNPPGPTLGIGHAVRGGGWANNDDYSRVDRRFVNISFSSSADSSPVIGFRCAVTGEGSK